MDDNEFKDLLGDISNKKKEGFDYEGFGIITDMKLSKAELHKVIEIIWEILMTSTTAEREKKYLFPHGLIKAKSMFLDQKNAITADTPFDKITKFNSQATVFKGRLQNVEPLVHFLIKIREVL